MDDLESAFPGLLVSVNAQPKEGGGNKFKDSQLGTVQRNDLKALYNDKGFLPAFRLSDPALAEDLK